MSEPDVFVVSGPSGAGKTTLIHRLLAEVSDLIFSVSYTTRPPREGEKDGVDYHFVSSGQFEAMRSRGGFLESAVVHERHYGTAAEPVDAVLAAGRDVLLDVDTQGAASVRRVRPTAVLIFILPPSLEVLRARLRGRRLESPQEAEARLRRARAEIERCGAYDYLVVNDQVNRAAEALKSIVLAHRARTSRQIGACRTILEDFQRV